MSYLCLHRNKIDFVSAIRNQMVILHCASPKIIFHYMYDIQIDKKLGRLKILAQGPTRSLKMSRWWTWIVMRVSYFTRSNSVSFLVVTSMRMFRRWRNPWLVVCIIFLSILALASASVESRVHNSCKPNNPIYKTEQFFLFSIIIRVITDILERNIFSLSYLGWKGR